MLYTDPHNQFAAQIEAEMRGASLKLEPSYAEAYQAWTAKNTNTLYKLSAEERTQAFTDNLEDEVVQREKEIIEKTETDPIQKKEKQNAAVRGDLLLVSTDNGIHFDQAPTIEEAQHLNVLSVRLLSPTLRSTTPNLLEVKEEQNMLHVLKKLRAEHFLINQVSIENHTVHVIATHPKKGQYAVEVKVNEDSKLPFKYKFTNAAGTKAIPETALPEDIKELPSDYSVDPALLESIRQRSTVSTEKQQPQNLLGAAALSSALGLYASKTLTEQSTMARALANAQATRLQMKSPAVHSNVMASKAAMTARKARQEKELSDEKKRILQRQEEAKKDADKHVKQMRTDEAMDKEKKDKQRKEAVLSKTKAIGAGAAGAALAGLGGVTALLVHVATISPTT